jgi:hypothetical protein
MHLDPFQQGIRRIQLDLNISRGQSVGWDKRPEGQLKQRVQGYTARIDRRYSGRRGNNGILIGSLNDRPQKSGLSGTCLSGKKYVSVRIIYKPGGKGRSIRMRVDHPVNRFG